MIQRIQSLYLLFVVLTCTVCAFSPLGRWIDAGSKVVSTMNAMNITTGDKESLIPLMGLLFIVGIVAVVAIFMYMERMKQARLCMLSLLLLVGWCVIYGVYAYLFTPDGASFRPEPAAALPMAGAVFSWLAWRAVLRDEYLVRSLDRLR